MTSGSSELDLDKNVSEFMKNYLTNIEDDGHLITLEFNNYEIPDDFRNIQGYLSTEKNKVKYTKLSEPVVNNDVLATVIHVKDLMKKSDSPLTPHEYYTDLMKCILEVGDLYSSFVELVLTHMLMVSPTEFWRYNQDKPVTLKLSEKTVAAKVSNLLAFLYQPNSISLKEIDPDDFTALDSIDPEKLTIHEKIFLNKL